MKTSINGIGQEIQSLYQKMVNHSVTLEDADRLLDAVVEFPDINASFERIRPITNFRKDDHEARILYLCRRVDLGGQEVNGTVQGTKDENLFVLKCKVQCVKMAMISRE